MGQSSCASLATALLLLHADVRNLGKKVLHVDEVLGRRRRRAFSRVCKKKKRKKKETNIKRKFYDEKESMSFYKVGNCSRVF